MKFPDKSINSDLEFLKGAVAAPTKGKCPETSLVGTFPFDALPNALQSIALSLSRFSRLNLAFHGMAALSVASAAVGRHLVTQSRHFANVTPCNLLVALCADTTGGKGILDMYSEPLHEYEDRLIHEYEVKRPRIKVELSVLRKKLRRLEAMIGEMVIEAEGEKERGIDQAAAMTAHVDGLISTTKSPPCLIRSSCSGAVLRNTLASNNGTCLLYSAEGSGDLINAFNGADPLLANLCLSGFSFERSKMDTLSNHYRGRPCISGLFALQSWRLRQILFSRDAAPLGFLNRLLVVDTEGLESREKDPHVDRDHEVLADWKALIEHMLQTRHMGAAEIVVPWSEDAESIFEGFRREVDALMEGFEESIMEHLGRFPELAMRIAGVYLAIEHMGLGYPLAEVREHRFIAEDAVTLARWLLGHRLKLQEQHLEVHYCGLARELTGKLSKNSGKLREIEVKENPRLAKGLEEVLRRHPERFKRKFEKTGRRGPSSSMIILLE